MHSLYKPRPGKVKDYIAVPRANGYQALQTSMIGPHGVPVKSICKLKKWNRLPRWELPPIGCIKKAVKR